MCLDSWVNTNQSIWHEVFDDGTTFQPFASSWMLLNPVSGPGQYPGFTSDGHQFTLDVLFYMPVDFNTPEVAAAFAPADHALLLQRGAWGGLVIGRIVSATRAEGAAFQGILCGAQDNPGTMWNHILINDRVADSTADQLEEYRDCFSAQAQAEGRQLCAVPPCPFDCQCAGTGGQPPEETWTTLCATSNVIEDVYATCMRDAQDILFATAGLTLAALIGATILCGVLGGGMPLLVIACVTKWTPLFNAVIIGGLALYVGAMAVCLTARNQAKTLICSQACNGLPISYP